MLRLRRALALLSALCGVLPALWWLSWWCSPAVQRQVMSWLHQQDLPVIFMTINDADEMRRLLARGARGIITDLPGLALEIVQQSSTPT